MYRTIARFTDLQDNNRLYRVGDEFPRPGLKVSKKRLQELSTNANRRKIPLIAEIAPPVEISKERGGKSDDVDRAVPRAEELVRQESDEVER